MDPLEFPFEHDRRFAPLLLPFGVTEARSLVWVTDAGFFARFGFFGVDVPIGNVADAEITGPYRFYKALGPRLSVADGGATYGTTAAGGVCISFHEKVPALAPVRSGSLTVTVADRGGLLAALQERIR